MEALEKFLIASITAKKNITFAEFRFNFVWASRVNVVRRAIIDTETYITMTFCVCLTHARRKRQEKRIPIMNSAEEAKKLFLFSATQQNSSSPLPLDFVVRSVYFLPLSSPSKHTEFVSHFVVDYVWLLHIHRTTKKRLSDDVMSVRFFHHVMLSPHFHPCYSTHCVSRPLPPLPPLCWNKNKHFSILQNFFFHSNVVFFLGKTLSQRAEKAFVLGPVCCYICGAAEHRTSSQYLWWAITRHTQKFLNFRKIYQSWGISMLSSQNEIDTARRLRPHRSACANRINQILHNLNYAYMLSFFFSRWRKEGGWNG